jgi:zinc transporter
MSSENGLVYSYILQGGKGRHIGWDGIENWTSEQGLLWLHLDYKNPGCKKWLQEKSGLDLVSCEALLAEETRPRIVSSPRSFLLILRGVNGNPGEDPEDMVSIRMWAEENRIITMRHRKVMAITDMNERIEKGVGPESASDFLVTLIGKLVDRMGDVISEIDDQVDELEDQVLTEESRELRPRLAILRRQTISLRRYISPQRDVLSRLQNERIDWLNDYDRVRMREIAERTSRFVDDLDAARDRATITQEELNSRLAEQSNKTMYILAIVTAIFLPLGLITGLLGINVGGMPGADNDHAFWFVGLMLIAFAFIQYLIFKRRKMI